MMKYEPSDELKEFIKDVTLDYSSVLKYGLAHKDEAKRISDTSLGIQAVFKKYKGIPLSEEEQEILNLHPLEDEDKDSVIKQVEYIAFEIAKATRNTVNESRHKLDTAYFILSRGLNEDKVSQGIKDITKVRDNYYAYIERLDYYVHCLVHAHVYEHEISLTNVNCEDIYPQIDPDGEIFTCVPVPTLEQKEEK